MTHDEVFAARLDRLHAEANATVRRTPPPPAPDGPMNRPPKKAFKRRQMFLPAVSLIVLFGGALALSTALASGSATPFDPNAAITSNTHGKAQANRGKDPLIEPKVQKRSLADPDLARLILDQ